MSNIVEYLVKIRDLASGPMRSFAGATEGAMNRITSRVRTADASIGQLNTRIEQLTRTREMSIDTRQIARAGRELDALERKRDKLDSSGRSGGGSMLGAGLMLGAVGAAGMIGNNMLKNGMDRQMAGVSFEVMAGKKQGDDLHQKLIKFATDTIYGNEVFGEAKMELGFGVAAKNIMPSMQLLGDIAMGDVEHMKSLTLGFSEAAAAGKLTGRELLIMIDAGFNPLQALAAKTGKSMGDLRKEMEKGKISFTDVVSAMQYATGPMGRFHNGMQKMGETPTGKWIAFKGALETLSGTLGMHLLPALGSLATIMTGFIGNPGAMLEVASAIGAMAAAWAAYTIYTKWATIQAFALEAVAFWPIAAVGLIAAALGQMANDYDEYSTSVEKAGDKTVDANGKIVTSMQETSKKVWTIGAFFKRVWEDISYYIEVAFAGIQSTFQRFDKLFSGNIFKTYKHFGDDTDADKYINWLRKKHENHIKMADAGLNDDGTKPGAAGTTPMSGLFDPKAQAGGGAPGGVADTAKGIAGGGIRNLVINIAKQGIDQITIHTTNLTEGKAQIEQMFIEMFNQVVNSGGSVIPEAT